MNETKYLTGKCLCGAVHVKAKQVTNKVGACHCEMCRRWHGGPQIGINGGSEVEFTNEELIQVYDSSPWAQRGFCKRCGSHLFYRLKAVGRYVLMAGILDETDGLEFDHQFFIDKKPDYYAFAGETHDLTEAEFMAKFGLQG